MPDDTQIALRGETDIAVAETPRGGTATQEVMALIAGGIEKGLDAESLALLQQMARDARAEDARVAFTAARKRFQAECPEIPKHQRVIIKGEHRYSFAPLETVLAIVRPVLDHHGLSIDFDSEPGPGGQLLVSCTLSHDHGHERTARFPLPTDTNAAMSTQQKYGAAMSFGKRYALLSVLGLSTGEVDRDGLGLDDGDESGATITDEEAADLRATVDDIGGGRHAKFLGLFNVEGYRDIKASQLPRARQKLADMQRYIKTHPPTPPAA